MTQKKIILAGGTGFIGRALTKEFLTQGFAVGVLSRSPHRREDGVREVAWDGTNASEWTAVLDGADAVVNLAGKSINCPHTDQNLSDITATRVNSVQAIATAIQKVRTPPRVWVQASAIGYYGDTVDQVCNESAPAGCNPLAEVCRQWETAFALARVPQTRKITLRIGFVLGRDGGALPVLSQLTRFFLGGSAGNGRQYISWIHLADLVRMFTAAVKDEKLSATLNAVAPSPVTNAEFMRELRRAWHRPWCPPAPVFAVKLGTRLLGSEAALVLVSQRCVPEKFLKMGFQFQFPDLMSALADLCR